MRLGLAVTALSLASLTAAQQIATIRVPVRLVTVPALVFSKEGRLIPGLQRTDFRVFDNGRLQKVTLDTALTPVSIVLAIQMNQDVRRYAPFIAKAGSVVEALLAGESGEAAVITYSDDVATVKPFDTGDVQSALRKISANGKRARTIDAGVRAIIADHCKLEDKAIAGAQAGIPTGKTIRSGQTVWGTPARELGKFKEAYAWYARLPELAARIKTLEDKLGGR